MKRNRNFIVQLGRNAKALRLRLHHAIRTNDREAFLRWLVRAGGESTWVFLWCMVPVSICIAPFHRNGIPFAVVSAILAMICRSINVDFGKCNQ